MSKVRSDVDPSECAKIVEKSQAFNAKHSLTGLLLFGDSHFVQCLEGDSKVVSELYAKIANDSRHEQVCLVDYSEISEREFVEWSMRLVLLTQEKKKLIFKYSLSNDQFNPYSMDKLSLFKLVCALK